MNPSSNEDLMMTYKEQDFQLQISIKPVPPKIFQNYHLKVIDAKEVLKAQINL